MEQLSDNYMDNVRRFDEVLGVGRSCDLVSRDYVIGGGPGCGSSTATARTPPWSGWAPSGCL